MMLTKWDLGLPEWLTISGASVFILVLALAAVFEADIRWLHFFQAWMYVVTIALSLRGNRWGYFIGIAAAGLWDYTNLFVTNFLSSGLQQVSIWVHTGHISRPDQLIAVAAWCSNLLVVIGCAWGYTRRCQKRRSDVARMLIAIALTMGWFAADMALFQPRYLSIFPRLLHPHWHLFSSTARLMRVREQGGAIQHFARSS